QSQKKYRQSHREASGKFIYPKDVIARCHQPIRKGRLFQIAHTVYMERDVVGVGEHLARSFRVRTVSIVEQRRREQRAKVNGGENENYRRMRQSPHLSRQAKPVFIN